MQSHRSKLVIALIRNRHLFKLKRKAEVVDENFSVAKFRDDIDRACARMKLPKDVSVEKTMIAQMQAEWIVPQRASKGKVLLYIHGGGFISGSCHTHRMHVAKFAKGAQLKSLLFDYRLAPEHPFPAALDDCITAYQWLLKQGFAGRDIVVGGESAGASLCLALLLALKENQVELPKAAFSISPITDLSCQAASFRNNALKDVAPMGSWHYWTKLYIGTHNIADPLLSPLFGDFSGLPPLFICVGTNEIHLDDCLHVARVALSHGVKVTLRKWEGMIHAFPLLSPLFPEAKEAMSEICRFTREQLTTTKPEQAVCQQ